MRVGLAAATRVPRHTFRWFPEGVDCTDASPGDLFLLRSKPGLIPRLIRFGEWLRKSDRVYSWANHAAIFTEPGIIAEAGPHGIALSQTLAYKHEMYAVIHPVVPPETVAVTLNFVQSKLGVKYAFVTLLTEALNAILHTRLSFGDGDHLICSAFAAEAWTPVGLVCDTALAVVMPADLARYFDAIPPK